MSGKDIFHNGLWRMADVLTTPVTPRPSSSAQVVEGLRECLTCGLFQSVPELRPGFVATCRRCSGQLARRRRTSPLGAPTMFCLLSALLYLLLLSSDLMTLNIRGRENTVSLFSGPVQLADQGFGLIGLLVGGVTLAVPGVVIVLMCAILYGVSHRHMPRWTLFALVWYERLRPWSMVEVYVIGVIVAYSKLIDLAVVTLQPGTYLLGGLMLTMAAMDSTFDEETIWSRQPVGGRTVGRHGAVLEIAPPPEAPPADGPESHMLSCRACKLVLAFDRPLQRGEIAGNCPRCHQTLRRRKPNSVLAAICFLTAAFLLYIPANLMPVMTYTRVGWGAPSTIISGVIELWRNELYFLSLLVLFASITVPVLKIISLTLMIFCECTKKKWHPWGLSRLYRLVVVVGRWSMIDVFMISILVAVVRFAFLAHVTANFGMVCFALVVILTIFAADLYDPRGMWDAAGLNGPALDAEASRREESSSRSGGQCEMEPERA